MLNASNTKTSVNMKIVALLVGEFFAFIHNKAFIFLPSDIHICLKS